MNPVAMSILLDPLKAKAKEVTTEAEQVALQKHIEEKAITRTRFGGFFI